MTDRALLTQQQFLRAVAEALDLDPDSTAADHRVGPDLGFDSVLVLELLLVVEELGAELPEQLDVPDLTLGDLYAFYAVSAGPASVEAG
jgi:hypothetical protein